MKSRYKVGDKVKLKSLKELNELNWIHCYPWANKTMVQIARNDVILTVDGIRGDGTFNADHWQWHSDWVVPVGSKVRPIKRVTNVKR